jgi:cysteine sulfinate desulfinase/cysteine desulfurase-like protein
MAMGLSEEEAHCAVRFSLGIGNTMDEIDRTVSLVARIVRENKDVIRFVACR